ncbi:hypothetical protein SAMN02949497_4668 [Methylomagnum ishizawai]|uniref:Uncharacterized protein n=1 Tax=Methylomagnum ishizawai TaxID=1760988 RepID=A0A1Y6D3L4_9GAMM|nr:hypothetical protein SAMN02949497_4668 [Methylomagnum ishizawai]
MIWIGEAEMNKPGPVIDTDCYVFFAASRAIRLMAVRQWSMMHPPLIIDCPVRAREMDISAI